MSKTRATPTLLVAMIALLYGCEERPTAPSVPDDSNPQLAKGGDQGPAQTVTFTFPSSELSDGLIFGDGRMTDADERTTYTGGECGVGTLIPDYNGNATLNTRSDKISPSEAAECGNSREGRYFTVRLETEPGDEPGLPWDDEIVPAKWIDLRYNIRAIPRGNAQDRIMKIWFDDGHQGGYGWADVCPWGLAYGFETVFGLELGSSHVRVERTKDQATDGVDEWLVETRPDEDVAVCLGGKSEPVALGYYHVPFRFTIECAGEC